MGVIIFMMVLGLAVLFCFQFKGKSTAQAIVDEKQAAIYKQLLLQHVDYYQNLSNSDKILFEKRVMQFLNDTRIEGVGTEITDLDKMLIAASAVIPVFGFPDWRYKNLTNVILYPDTFDGDYQFEGGTRNIMGMVGNGGMNGQMLLSRQALVRGFSKNNGKENTAIHEFVHLLDKTDGATDGIPENFIAPEYATPWLQMMHREMRRIQQGKSDINPYATTSEAEFLAVAAEYFFEKPGELQDKHPEIYRQLSLIFGQDPAAA